jgi:hypothetical protein
MLAQRGVTSKSNDAHDAVSRFGAAIRLRFAGEAESLPGFWFIAIK